VYSQTEVDMTARSATDSHEKHSVFFSHRSSDARVTSLLIDLLDRHTENVSFFSSQKIEEGVWRNPIAEHLNRANFLVLVVTDSNEDLGSCIYEAGYFAALSRESPRRRIWCLHHALILPPRPLADLQTIPAKTPEVEYWIKELFKETEQTKAEFLDAIPELADEICKLFPQKL
jgi:hypothetical protein